MDLSIFSKDHSLQNFASQEFRLVLIQMLNVLVAQTLVAQLRAFVPFLVEHDLLAR